MATIRDQNMISFEEKGCIVKGILIALLFALSICSAKTDGKSTKPSSSSKIDVPKADCCDLAEKQNEIKKSIDSIAIKATEKSLAFYDSSFRVMQDSYKCFVNITIIGIIFISIVVVFICVWVKIRSYETIKEIKQLPIILETAKTMLPRFKEAAKSTNYNIELGELKPRNYVHILRDGKEIGCFMYHKGNIVFECHTSYENPKEKIQLSDLIDKKIEYILKNTPRKGTK
jgi:hypothetical protein